MLTGNKGEWSEIYALLKLIADKNLYVGNSSLNRIENIFYPIVKILRDESESTFTFSYEDELVVIKNEKQAVRISIAHFKNAAIALLAKIKQSSSSSFAVPEIEAFINQFNCKTLKAKSSIKSDIQIVIHDEKLGFNPILGFSIKSQLGNPSTLLNAGRTTNFNYKISNLNLSDSEIELINAIQTRSKIKDRILAIQERGGVFLPQGPLHQMFKNNLTLIDSALPTILGDLIFTFYSSNLTKVVDLISQSRASNPMDYDMESNHPFYSYKIKRFLSDVALGMMPSKVWKGRLEATGGYLIIKADGDIVCYHIYNRNEFEEYLLKNTKLETASSSRHDFGYLYKENHQLFFKLNLQIRFLK